MTYWLIALTDLPRNCRDEATDAVETCLQVGGMRLSDPFTMRSSAYRPGIAPLDGDRIVIRR